MDRTSFITNPSFDMSLPQKRRTTIDRTSFLSNPSFDMSLPDGNDETITSNRRSFCSQQRHERPDIPPTPVPTQESDTTSSSSSSSPAPFSQAPQATPKQEEPRTIEIYEESAGETSETSYYLQQEEEEEQQQSQLKRAGCLNYVNFLMCLANVTVACLKGGEPTMEIYDYFPTLITPAHFCFIAFQGMLYVLQFLWATSQILGKTKHHPLVIDGVGWYYVLIVGCQIAWYFLFSEEYLSYAMTVHTFLTGMSLWLVLHRMTMPTNNVPEYLTLQLQFDLHAAWAVGTYLINANITLAALGASNHLQVVVAYVSLTVMVLIGIGCLAILLRRNLSSSSAPPPRGVVPLLVLGWICIGMASAKKSDQVGLVESFPSSTLWTMTRSISIVTGALLLSTIIFLVLVLRRQHHPDSTTTTAVENPKHLIPQPLNVPTPPNTSCSSIQQQIHHA
eukprot:scaffold4306_cov154-Cylindrotheca_fusiformis.AAC.4